jgi:hypothetical protein
MALKIGSDKPAVPGPIVFGIRRRMNAGETAAVAYVAFKRRLLPAIENIARGIQENKSLITGQVGVGKS